MSELPVFSEVLSIRPEVLSNEGILDMVDLAAVTTGDDKGTKRKRLKDQTVAMETLGDPAAFFRLTYPTEDIKQTLQTLQQRLVSPDTVAGTILLNGRYGLGKSHILLAAHHALTAPTVARRWAEQWSLPALELPSNVRLVTRSFIRRTAENLWDPVFEAFGRPELSDSITTYPDGKTIESLLDDRPTVLILDELERWYDALAKGKKSRNRNFIQALTQVANRDSRITILTSVLGELPEPAETLRRTKPFELAFRSATDRQQVLLYRLFENHASRDQEVVERVADAYVSSWNKAGLENLDQYRQRLLETYPFTPEFLDILTKKVPNLGGFQNTRGSLRFLARVVKATKSTRPLISSQDLPFRNRAVQNALTNLDTTGGDIVRRALGDSLESVPDSVKHKDELFSSILFYSIADPANPGITESEVLLSVLDPGENQNEIRDSLRQLRRLAATLHVLNDRYVFRTHENPRARINAVAYSQRVTVEACRAVVEEALRKAWGAEKRTVLFGQGHSDLSQIGRELKQIANPRPCYLLSSRRLDPQTRLQLQNLHPLRNLVLLIEPNFRTERTATDRDDILLDEDVLGHARLIEACRLLLEGKPEERSAKVYRDVQRQEEGIIATEIADRYGYYVSWNRAGSSDSDIDDSWYELGRVDEFRAEKFFEHFEREYGGLPAIRTRVKELWTSYQHRPVRDLSDYFDQTPGEPIPHRSDMVTDALRKLAGDGVIGLQSPTGETFCRQTAQGILPNELPRYTIVSPPPIDSEPDKPERLPTHEFVSAQYNPTTNNVEIRWEHPSEGGPYDTLIQRFINIQQRDPGQQYKFDLDRTHEANRFLGPGSEYCDQETLSPGVRFYYYVYLVERNPAGDPRIVLSQRCDVEIPSVDLEPLEGVLEITSQPDRDKLLGEIEKRIMTSKHMPSNARVRKLEIRIDPLRNHDGLAELFSELPLDGGTLDTRATVLLEIRGTYDRQEVMGIVRKLPRLDAMYSARLYLADQETS